MRVVARLTFLYVLSFLFLLLVGVSVSVMREWLLAAQAIDPVPFPLTDSLFNAFAVNVPLGAYGAALLVLPSAVHRGYGLIVTGFTVFLLTGAAFFVGTYGTATFSKATPEIAIPLRRLESPTAVIRTEEADIAFVGGSAVEAKSGSQMVILSKKEAIELIRDSNPTLTLGSFTDLPASLASIGDDIAGSARRLSEALGRDKLQLVAYSFALALLLASFSPLAGATRWPLADLILCALAFRGVLIFEKLAASGPVLRFVENLGYPIPDGYVVPGILALAGLLIAAGGTVVRLARKGA